MAAITTLSSPKGSLFTLHGDGLATAGTETEYVLVPDWAKWMIVYLNVTAATGTIDLNINEVDPVALDDSYVVNLADWNGITQLTGVSQVVIHVGPGITGIADDDTGGATGDSVYKINTMLPPILQFVVIRGAGGGDTYTLNGVFKKG